MGSSFPLTNIIERGWNHQPDKHGPKLRCIRDSDFDRMTIPKSCGWDVSAAQQLYRRALEGGRVKSGQVLRLLLWFLEKCGHPNIIQNRPHII